MARRFKGPYKIIAKDKDIYKLESIEDQQVITRHVSAMKRFVQRAIAATVIINFVVGSCIADNLMFDCASPVFWKEVPKYVSKGTVHLPFELHFTSPCELLLKYSTPPQQRAKQVPDWTISTKFQQTVNTISNGIKPLLNAVQTTCNAEKE